MLDEISIDSMDMNLSKILGDSGGQRSLVDYSPKVHKELDTTTHACILTREANNLKLCKM